MSYERMDVTALPSAGQRRVVKSFDFKMSMLNEATFDILFTKVKVTHTLPSLQCLCARRLHVQLLASFQDTQQETQAIHLAMQAGSYLEFSVPMLVEESGYTTKVYGQAMNVDCSTSLPFRDFIKCETLEVGLSCSCSAFILLRASAYSGLWTRCMAAIGTNTPTGFLTSYCPKQLRHCSITTKFSYVVGG